MKLKYTLNDMFPFSVIGFSKDISYENSKEEIKKFLDEISQKYSYSRIYRGPEAENDYKKATIENSIGEYGLCIQIEIKISSDI